MDKQATAATTINKDDLLVITGAGGFIAGAVERRMAELGVAHVIQGCRDKVAAFDDLVGELHLTAAQCAFVGDDIPDLPLLKVVGFPVAVANAVREVREFCDYTTRAPGGSGAVREVCELVLAAGADG